MFDGLPRFRLAALELRFTAADKFRFFGCEHVVRINHTLWFKEHSIVFLRERHKVTLAHLELIQDLAGYDNLAALSNAAESFLCGGFAGRAFRLSD
jgi:hypothetical protein